MKYTVTEFVSVCEVEDEAGRVHAVFTDAVDKDLRKRRAIAWASEMNTTEAENATPVESNP